jgi:hypothetical protein
VGGAVAFGRLRPVLLVAPVGADPKPNFHRNNDRKSGGGMQGDACCVFFELFVSQSEKSPEQNGSAEVNPANVRLGENSAERKRSFTDLDVAEATTHKELYY